MDQDAGGRKSPPGDTPKKPEPKILFLDIDDESADWIQLGRRRRLKKETEPMAQAEQVQRLWNGIYETHERLQKKAADPVASTGAPPGEPKQKYIPDTEWRIPVVEMNDDQLYEDLCHCVFNAGIKQEVLDSKLPGIKKAFADFHVDEVADLPKDHVEVVLADPDVLRNRRKVAACLKNAAAVQGLRPEWKSFANYLMGFARAHGPGALADDLQARFAGIGPATGPQFLKDLGFDMFKADAHVRNILSRTALISAKTAPLREVGAAFDLLKEAEDRRAGRADSWLSNIDWVLFSYGKGAKLDHPVCESRKPRCDECGASPYCPKNGVR